MFMYIYIYTVKADRVMYKRTIQICKYNSSLGRVQFNSNAKYEKSLNSNLNHTGSRYFITNLIAMNVICYEI